MGAQPTRPTSKHLAEILNRLIVACNDVARAQTSASRIVAGDDRRGNLDVGAGRSTALATELGGLVRALGGLPARGGSSSESIRALLHQVNAWVIGENAGDAYVHCERVEAVAEKLYEDASQAVLPPETKTIILRHLAQVSASRLELRRLAMRG